MPDLRIIEGGGGDGGGKDTYAAHRARMFFQDLVIELLRDLARDASESWRISKLLFEFWNAAAESEAPVFELIDPVLRASRDRLFQADYLDPQYEREEIIRHAFRVVAESLASDGAARGRASQRQSRLTSAIEQFVIGQESTAREYGWSYVGHLTKGLEPLRTRPARPSPQTKSAAKPKAPNRKRAPTVTSQISRPPALKEPIGTTPPSYDGLRRYAASLDELQEVGVLTIDELVSKANALMIGAGLWPLSQGDFPATRTQFRKVVRIIQDLTSGS